VDVTNLHCASSRGAASSLAYRFAIPLGLLCLYAIMAVLWLSGAHPLCFGVLRLLGIEPFGFPFLDTHAVLAAAECRRQGIDVYLSNPCDVLGRPHGYSPLWLEILPGSLGSGATRWVAAALTAGLLKYYPLALLILVTRERRHDKIIAAAVIGSMLICFALAFYPELGKAFASVPVASSYFTDAFSARPLPCTIRLIQYTRLHCSTDLSAQVEPAPTARQAEWLPSRKRAQILGRVAA